jgi:hypothetical protein
MIKDSLGRLERQEHGREKYSYEKHGRTPTQRPQKKRLTVSSADAFIAFDFSWFVFRSRVDFFYFYFCLIFTEFV